MLAKQVLERVLCPSYLGLQSSQVEPLYITTRWINIRHLQGGGGEYLHVKAIRICTAVKGAVYRQFSLG